MRSGRNNDRPSLAVSNLGSIGQVLSHSSTNRSSISDDKGDTPRGEKGTSSQRGHGTGSARRRLDSSPGEFGRTGTAAGLQFQKFNTKRHGIKRGEQAKTFDEKYADIIEENQELLEHVERLEDAHEELMAQLEARELEVQDLRAQLSEMDQKRLFDSAQPRKSRKTLSGGHDFGNSFTRAASRAHKTAPGGALRGSIMSTGMDHEMELEEQLEDLQEEYSACKAENTRLGAELAAERKRVSERAVQIEQTDLMLRQVQEMLESEQHNRMRAIEEKRELEDEIELMKASAESQKFGGTQTLAEPCQRNRKRMVTGDLFTQLTADLGDSEDEDEDAVEDEEASAEMRKQMSFLLGQNADLTDKVGELEEQLEQAQKGQGVRAAKTDREDDSQGNRPLMQVTKSMDERIKLHMREQELKDLQDENQKAKAENVKLHKREQEVRDLQDEFQKVKAENIKLQSEAGMEKLRGQQQLMSIQEAAEGILKQVQKTLENEQEARIHLEQENLRLTEDIRCAQEEQADVARKRSEGSNESHVSASKSERAELAKKKEAIKQFTAARFKLSAQLKKVKTELAAKDQSHTEALGRQQQAFKKVEERATQLQIKLDFVHSTLSEKEADFQHSSSAKDAGVEAIQSKLVDAQTALSHSTRHVSDLSEELCGLRGALESARVEIQAAEEEHVKVGSAAREEVIKLQNALNVAEAKAMVSALSDAHSPKKHSRVSFEDVPKEVDEVLPKKKGSRVSFEDLSKDEEDEESKPKLEPLLKPRVSFEDLPKEEEDEVPKPKREPLLKARVSFEDLPKEEEDEVPKLKLEPLVRATSTQSEDASDDGEACGEPSHDALQQASDVLQQKLTLTKAAEVALRLQCQKLRTELVACARMAQLPEAAQEATIKSQEYAYELTPEEPELSGGNDEMRRQLSALKARDEAQQRENQKMRQALLEDVKNIDDLTRRLEWTERERQEWKAKAKTTWWDRFQDNFCARPGAPGANTVTFDEPREPKQMPALKKTTG